MQSRQASHKNGDQVNQQIPPPSTLPKLIKIQSDKEQVSPLSRRKQQQQQAMNNDNNMNNNNQIDSAQTLMHLKPVNLELSAVTSVKIVSSKMTQEQVLLQPSPVPVAPEPSPALPMTRFANDSGFNLPVYKSSKHFVEQDGIGMFGGSRQSPPPFISAVTPKMQTLVWGSGGFPARLKPVRVKRPEDNNTPDKSSSPTGERLRPLEPKLFDFSGADRCGHESFTDSNEDFEDYNPPSAMGGLQIDDTEGGTMVGRNIHSDLVEPIDRKKVTTSPSAEKTARPVTRLTKSSSNDRLAQYISNGNNGNMRPAKLFPPVTAMPVIPPLGHTFLTNYNSNNSGSNNKSESSSWGGLPRLPPLKQFPPSMPIKGDKQKQHSLNGNNGKLVPLFSMSLIGTKAVTMPGGSIANSNGSGSGSTNNREDRSTRLLSLSGGHAELSSAFRNELRKEKKPAISP